MSDVKNDTPPDVVSPVASGPAAALSLPQARQIQAEAKMLYEQEYARALIAAPEVASKVWMQPRSKISEGSLKQFALNDAGVRRARTNLLEANALLSQLEEDQAAEMATRSPRQKADECLAAIYLADYGESAAAVLAAVREQVGQVADNIKHKKQLMDERVGRWERKFWQDFYEDVTIYASDLSDYAENLRSVLRQIPAGQKEAASELRAAAEYVQALKDDCGNFIKLARAQSGGFW